MWHPILEALSQEYLHLSLNKANIYHKNQKMKLQSRIEKFKQRNPRKMIHTTFYKNLIISFEPQDL